MTRPSNPKLSLLTVQESLRRSRVGEALRPVVKRGQRLETFTRRLMTARGGPAEPPGRRTAEGDQSDNEVANETALQLLRNGEVAAADVLLTGFVHRFPHAHRSRFLLGAVRLYSDEFEAARTLIDEAIAHASFMRDDLGSVPGFYRLVGRAAEAWPEWDWPSYFIAKSVQMVASRDDTSLTRLIDTATPPVVVAFTAGEGVRSAALPLQLLAPRDRVVVFEASKRALSRRARELQALPHSSVHHLESFPSMRLGTAGDASPTRVASTAIESAGIGQVDLLYADAGSRSATIVVDVLQSGRRPAAVRASLNEMSVAQRRALLGELELAGYLTQVDYAELTAVHEHQMAARRAHGWRVSSADFDPDVVDDWISDPGVELAENVRTVLEEHQVRFFISPTETFGVTRFSIGKHDRNFAISRILEVGTHRGRLHLENLQLIDGSAGLVRFFLVEDERRLRRQTIELDCWTREEDYFVSKNPNRFVNWIPLDDVEKTPFAFNPAFLLSDEEKPVRLEDRLGLHSTVLHHVDFPVDVVYTWVDSEDPEWRQRRQQFQPSETGQEEKKLDDAAARYRNRDELRYSMRSLASFFPMVRHIYLVTDRQVPSWLDRDHPSITLIDHADIFSNSNVLPTFNSNAIESQLHRIPGLAEHSLYFNDDVLLLGPCNELDFFHASGLARSFLEERRSQYGSPAPVFHNSKNAVLGSSSAFERHFGKSYHQFHLHTPLTLRKSVMESMVEVFRCELSETASHRFRSRDDVAPISSLLQWYGLLQGTAVPDTIDCEYVNLGAATIAEGLERLAVKPTHAVLCLNDAINDKFSEGQVDDMVHRTLERLFPVPAAWEKLP